MNPDQQPQHPIPPDTLSNAFSGPVPIQPKSIDPYTCKNWQEARLPEVKGYKAFAAFYILSKGVTNCSKSLALIARIGCLSWAATNPNNVKISSFLTKAIIVAPLIYVALEASVFSLSAWSAVALGGAMLAHAVDRGINKKNFVSIVENPDYRRLYKNFNHAKSQFLRALSSNLLLLNAQTNSQKNIIPEQINDLIVSYLNLAIKECFPNDPLKLRTDWDFLLGKVHTAARLLDVELTQDGRKMRPDIFFDTSFLEAWLVLKQVALAFEAASLFYANNQPNSFHRLEFQQHMDTIEKSPLNVVRFESLLYELRSSHLKSLQ